MVEYKILIKDRQGNRIGEFETFKKLSYGKKLNYYGECSFEIPVADPKAALLIGLRTFTTHIYRDGELKWAGEQATRDAELTEDGDDWATIFSYTWLEQLAQRYTVFEDIHEFEDMAQILLDLIETTQGELHGDMGITEGDIESTTPIDVTYNNTSILDAAVGLGNRGLNFEINDSKALNAKSFIGVDRSGSVILEHGVNAIATHITDDFSKPATRALVLGTTPNPADGQLRTERDSESLQSQYGLREYLYNNMEPSDPETFEINGDNVLLKYGQSLTKLSMEITRDGRVTIDDFALGDLIRVIVKKGIYNIDRKFRVFEWTVTYNEDNSETLNIELGDFNVPEV